MPPRALRKLQRQRERDRLAALEKPDESEDEEDEIVVQRNTKPASAFALLGSPLEEDNHDDDDEDLADDPDAAEDKPTLAEAPSNEDQVTSKSKKKRKAKKAKKKTQATATNVNSTDSAKPSGLDDIDAALKELQVEDAGKARESNEVRLDGDLHDFFRLLSVDSKNLKVLNEMKRLFGSSALEAEDEGGNGGRRRGRGPRQLDLGAALDRRNHPESRGQALSERVLRRNIFVQGKDGWVRQGGGGLSMQVVEQPDDFVTEYCYVHNLGYQRTQRDFNALVESMDPQRMIDFIHLHPYHISGLLQVSEIARQNQEPAVSVDLIERALFSFGRAALSAFGTGITEGRATMDFRRPENRELWLAGWRYVRALGQRGTWRTAFEWAKLLFQLDPEGDPYRIRLVIDQLALRAGQSAQLIGLAAVSTETIDWGQDLPNIRISLAVAHDRLKQPREARAVLADAVQRWPWVIAQLLRELDIDRIPKSVWGKEPRTPRENLHSSAYVTRARDIWNTPEAISLLVEVAESTEPLAHLPPPEDVEIDLEEARHILLDETPALIGLLPRDITNQQTSASDPLPPHPMDNFPSYVADPNTEPRPVEDDSSEISDEGSRDERGLWAWAERMLGITTEERRQAVEAALPAPPQPQNEADEVERRASRRTVDRQARALAQEQLLGEQEDAMLAEAIRQSQAELEARQAAEVATGERPGAVAATTAVAVDRSANAAPASGTTDASAASTSTEAEPPLDTSDSQRVQRWLAGRGLLALKEFCAEHGSDEDAWPFTLRDERAGPVRDYVAHAKILALGQRRFILDFALPQGAGKEAGELIKRLVGR